MASFRNKVLKSGATRIEARIVRRSLPAMSKLFKTKTEAKRWATEMEARIDSGKSVSKGGKALFQDVVEAYIRAESPTGNNLQMVNALAFHLKDFALVELNNERLKKFIKSMGSIVVAPPATKKKSHPLYNGDKDKHYADGTIRKYYLQLETLIKWHATKENYDLPANLFTGIVVPGAWTKPRNRRLKEGEWELLLQSVKLGSRHHYIYPILLELFVETAMRTQELLRCKWVHVDLANRDIRIPAENVKTRTFRAVPMSKRTVALLNQLAGLRSLIKPDDHLFPEWRDSATLSRSFKRLTARVKIEDLHVHDLRHEAISRLYEKTNLSDVEIMKITGHTNATTLSRYANIRSSNLADKLN